MKVIGEAMFDISRRNLLGGTAATFGMIGIGPATRLLAAPAPARGGPYTEWRHYAADQANTRYSPLDQITAENFADLEIAWSFKTDMLGARKEYQFEPTPLLIKGRLFLTAGSRRNCVARVAPIRASNALVCESTHAARHSAARVEAPLRLG